MFELQFSTDNAAFDDIEAGISKTLMHVLAAVRNGSLSGTILDDNGNTIGTYRHEGETNG